MYQTTLIDKFVFAGVGLHSGKEMRVVVSPAEQGKGMMFRRSDVSHCPYVKITPFNVTSTQLATTISCGDFPISTIEHLVSALYGLGVDNVYVDVDGAEVPIMDGSSAPIVELILQAGITELPAKRMYLQIERNISVQLDEKTVDGEKCDELKITFEIDYPHAAIRYQKSCISLTPDVYIHNISNSRTFGFKKEVDALLKMGLAKGGSIDNAIVLDDTSDQILNPEGLRHESEFVSHKILDLIGDFSLIGHRVHGHIHAVKSGHHVNNIFARKLMDSLNSYSLVELSDDQFAYGYLGKSSIKV